MKLYAFLLILLLSCSAFAETFEPWTVGNRLDDPGRLALPDDRWAAGFAPTGCDGVVFAVEAGEHGELYVGGLFSECGGVTVNNVARYEPATGTWSPLGSGAGNGVDDRVRALAVVGGELFVGGEFLNANVGDPITANRVARWDGSAWSALGSGGGNGVDDNVLVLGEAGGELYVGGNFDVANVGSPLTVHHVARWDGSAWSALGSGGGVGTSNNVFALAELGGDLYVGGAFQEVNVGAPVAARFVARWDGASWSALGPGLVLSNSVSAFAVAGSDLYLGGGFTGFVQGGAFVVSQHVARWDGTSLSALASADGVGVGGGVTGLAIVGGDLYVAGSFTEVNVGPAAIPAHNIARWDGSSWFAVGSGGGEGVSGGLNTLAVADGVLYAGGVLERANLGGEEIAARQLAAWDGTSWSSVASFGGVAERTSNGLPAGVFAVAVRGDVVYFGGLFSAAGGVAANNLVAYDRSTGVWSALGTGAGNGTNNLVRTLVVDGDDLYVGGDFTQVNTGDAITANRIARWDGSAWHTVGDGAGEGVDNQVEALAVCGGELYVGGRFSEANVGAPVSANRIARWDGSAWHPVGSGGGNGVSSDVYALACGAGDVFAAGAFVNANLGDSVRVDRIARWDGSAWHPLGSGAGMGLNSFVYSLAVSDGAIYAGGTFTQANVGEPISANRVARWDGSAWSSLGGGADSTVWTLVADGDALYAGGSFTTVVDSSPVAASRLAHWTGSDWATLASGTDGTVRAMAFASPDRLAVGGSFDVAGDELSSRVGFYTTRGTLSVSIDAGSGEVSSSPAGIVCPGACAADFAWDRPIQLTATAGPGYAFDSWSGACGGSGPCVVRLSDETQVGATFVVAPEADLAITVGDARDPLAAGVTSVHTVEVSNLGPGQATGVTVTGALPAGLTLVATQGCAEDPVGLPTCTLGSIDSGGAASFTVEASVDPGAGAAIVYDVCVDAVETDPQSANDCASETTSLDLVAPSVTGIATATRGIGSCDTVRERVRVLRVELSEPLVATGPGDPASVDDPANYRLVRAAPGSDFATADCQSGPGGDTAISIGAVAWDVGARVAGLVLGGGALDDGLYRLVVCGSLEDPAGNGLDGGSGAGSDFASTFRVDARNLLADGHFDRYHPSCALDAWTSSDLTQVELGDPDADGSPLSGSAGNASAAAFDLAQCVAVDGDGLYTLTSGLRVDASNGDEVAAELFCEHFGAASCGGSGLGASQLSVSSGDTGAAFEVRRLDIATPPGAVSALCGLVADPGGASVDVFADQLSLVVKPLFADGFESSDLDAWSSATR